MATRRRQAILQVNELEKYQRPLLLEFRKSMQRIKRAALKDPEGFLPEAESEMDPVFDDLENQILKSQLVAHMLGSRRARLQMKLPLGQGLDVFSDVVNLIGGASEERIAELTLLYSEETRKVLQGLTTKLGLGIRESLAEAIRSNVAPRAALRSFFSKSGLEVEEGQSSYFLENLLRTSTQAAYGAARWQEYASEEAAEIIWGFEYLTVGDQRVRPDHAAMAGVTMPKGSDFWKIWWPPNGWSCRCQAVPVFSNANRRSPPPGILPDTGFSFNPGILFNTRAAA